MSSLLANHAWYELVRPINLLLMAFVCYWYYKSIINSSFIKVERRHKRYFYIAAGAFFLVKVTPFAIIAEEYLVSALVLQLSVIAFVSVPLLILSIPKQYLKIFFWRHERARVAKFLFKYPWPLAAVFNGLVILFLVPTFFNIIVSNAFYLFLYEILLVLFAFLTWWVIIQPINDLADHSYFMRGVYVFIMALLLMPTAFFLIATMKEMFFAYESTAGELFPGFTLIYDQQLAGGFLKLLQLSSYGTAIFYLLKMWGIKEEENEGQVDENTRVVQGVVIQLNEHNKRKSRKKR